MKTKPEERTDGVIVEPGPIDAQLQPVFSEGPNAALPNFKLKQILVPVDFSECTEKALLYAVPFARQFNATLTLLHVVEPPYLPASEMGVVVEVESKDDARKELETLRGRLAGKVPCQTMVRKGSAQIEIIDAAKELGCDLIILGSHGRTGVERLLMGSTVEKVVRRAGCPILIVRPHEHDFITGSPNDWQPACQSQEAELQTAMKASL
jgi:universal stress protein A